MLGTLTHKVHSQAVVVVVVIVVFLLGGGELQSGHFLNAQAQNTTSSQFARNQTQQQPPIQYNCIGNDMPQVNDTLKGCVISGVADITNNSTNGMIPIPQMCPPGSNESMRGCGKQVYWLDNFTGPKQAQNGTFSFGLPPFAKTHNNLTETQPSCSDDPSVVCNVLPSVIPFQPPPHQNQAAPRNETTTYPPTPICMYGPVIECTTPPPNTMFSAGPCDSPLFAHFYRNVLTRHVQGCTATSPPFKLNSGKEVTIAGPGSGHKRVL